jgi:succinoglycan biosynthesis protein ExoA
MPVLDEAAGIDEVLESVAAQDYRGEWEVVIADGGSTDGTLDRLAAWTARMPRWRVVHNPERTQSPGINLAVAQATGEVIVRMDAHTTYEPDYVTRSVEALVGSGAVAVGGAMAPEGTTRFGRAVAAAMRSPLMIGPARFHRHGASGEVDTVYLGAFRRADFLDAGGLRSFPSNAGEDADLYHRWRKQGRSVLLDPGIRSTYRPRSTASSLLRQNFRYGRAKAELLWANGAWPSWRPAAPLLLVGALVAGGLVWGVGGPAWPLVLVVAAWAVALVVAAPLRRILPLVVAVGALMHLAYGVGLWWGLVRGPRPVRRWLERGGEDG